MEDKFLKLIENIKKYNPKVNQELIRSAWEYAQIVHADQKRLSGEPYVTHVLAVATILVEWKMDTTTVVAGLLHDTIEDGKVTKNDIIKDFGVEVADLVDGVTKVTGLRLNNDKKEEFIEGLRKMILVMAKDLRVVFIKLADRIHNLETLQYLEPENQKRNAFETLEVYAPLAERLGMGEVKRILEDLAFPYAYPEEYKKVKEISVNYYVGASEIAWTMRRDLLKILKKMGIDAEISTRKKHLYSLWKKLVRPNINWDFSKVNDIVAIRIMVGFDTECYVALGLVHNLYKPVPHIGISDFIAQPKPNGYRSIHTKVFGPTGKIVEVQIRTFDMHDQAESGLSAHWRLSEFKSKKGVTSEDIERGDWKAPNKLSWVKELVKWQKQISDSQEFINAVKFDALAERIFVFSPKGDVFDLPQNATPVDFACLVHTNLIHYIKAAKVDNRMVPLNYQLKSGQVIEILKSKNSQKPNKDWLRFVATTGAKNEIKKTL